MLLTFSYLHNLEKFLNIQDNTVAQCSKSYLNSRQCRTFEHFFDYIKISIQITNYKQSRFFHNNLTNIYMVETVTTLVVRDYKYIWLHYMAD